MRCIDPVVMPPAHNMFLQLCTKLKFVNGNLRTLWLAIALRRTPVAGPRGAGNTSRPAPFEVGNATLQHQGTYTAVGGTVNARAGRRGDGGGCGLDHRAV